MKEYEDGLTMSERVKMGYIPKRHIKDYKAFNDGVILKDGDSFNESDYKISRSNYIDRVNKIINFKHI